MSDITNSPQQHIPAPQLERKNHVPSVGDIYFDRTCIIRLVSASGSSYFDTEAYEFSSGTWKKSYSRSVSDLTDYYRLLLCDFDDAVRIAKAAVDGDASALNGVLASGDIPAEPGALVAGTDKASILALTAKAEHREDQLKTIRSFMETVIEQRRAEMEAAVRALSDQIESLSEKVSDLQQVITILNLYTGRTVDLIRLSEGAPAPADEPVTLRQRILFMDEEYLADADNGGIDYTRVEEFYEWLKRPENRDVICPEQKCIVAMKPKRLFAQYSTNYHDNAVLNKWNKHTYVVIRNGENLWVTESEDLELYGVALPYSDQQDRFREKADRIMSERSFQESNMERLNKEMKSMAYMYLKYLSFLQGIIDAGAVFDLSAGRPELQKETGVRFIRDDEDLVGNGEGWFDVQDALNNGIRRGTRVLFCNCVQDEYGRPLDTGKLSSRELRDKHYPYPRTGLYNVDYPTVTDYVKKEGAPRMEHVLKKCDRLAIYYNSRLWNEGSRREAWLYTDRCVINYDALTVETVDRLMSDRTQRPYFRSWMPLLQRTRRELLKEAADERAFAALIQQEVSRRGGPECQDTIREAIAWWKSKVIFTRPLRSDDAKAFRMILAKVKRDLGR